MDVIINENSAGGDSTAVTVVPHLRNVEVIALGSNSQVDVTSPTIYVQSTLAHVNTPVPGPEGDSAYDIAVQNGFEGTESEWLTSLSPTGAALLALEDHIASPTPHPAYDV